MTRVTLGSKGKLTDLSARLGLMTRTTKGISRETYSPVLALEMLAYSMNQCSISKELDCHRVVKWILLTRTCSGDE
jgi:hypothetical protein